MDGIPEELRPTRLFDFKSIMPMSAAELQNIDEVKETLRRTIDEEYAGDGAQLHEKLRESIRFSNNEIADTLVT